MNFRVTGKNKLNFLREECKYLLQITLKVSFSLFTPIQCAKAVSKQCNETLKYDGYHLTQGNKKLLFP